MTTTARRRLRWPRIFYRPQHAAKLRIDLATTDTLPRLKVPGRPPWETAPQPAYRPQVRRGEDPYADEQPISLLPMEYASSPLEPVPFFAALYARGRAQEAAAKTARDAVQATDIPPVVDVRPGPDRGRLRRLSVTDEIEQVIVGPTNKFLHEMYRGEVGAS